MHARMYMCMHVVHAGMHTCHACMHSLGGSGGSSSSASSSLGMVSTGGMRPAGEEGAPTDDADEGRVSPSPSGMVLGPRPDALVAATSLAHFFVPGGEGKDER